MKTKRRNNKFDSRDVYFRLKIIFKERFNIDVDQKESTFFDRNLLYKEIGLEARDLLYLFFDIEKEYNITIPEEVIVDGKFNTFNKIVEIIHNQLKKKGQEVV
ncbi:peptide maturation system acyl carrier-related protein [Ruminiclostridium cellobioparum]|uniref:peptide maturation system acyl carrier-related protein n=1 Tax=Ruminiclostridium cellobioparum TaxID=29355 RepID=UPI0028AAB5DE|nr:peptide maturation system acyl carrier-related protein [Ruminiclostridium cellobioparum]